MILYLSDTAGSGDLVAFLVLHRASFLNSSPADKHTLLKVKRTYTRSHTDDNLTMYCVQTFGSEGESLVQLTYTGMNCFHLTCLHLYG